MQFAAGPPSIWRLRLRSGAAMEVWADAYAQTADWYEFTVLVDATTHEASLVRVDRGWSATSGHTCMIVARVPVAEVMDIEGGWSLPDDEGDSPPRR